MARLSPVCWVLLLFLLLRLCAFGGWRLSMWPCCFTWRFCLLHRQKAAKTGFVFGCAFFCGGLWWIFQALSGYIGLPYVLALPIWALLCALLATFHAAAAFIARAVYGRLLGLLAAAAGWVLLEWLRAHLFTGFPWLAAGYSQIPDSPLVGFAPVLGINGVTFALTLSAALITFAILPNVVGRRRLGALAAAAAIFIGGGFLHHLWQWTTPVGKTTVSLLQGNVEQNLKWRKGQVTKALTDYLDMAEKSSGKIIILPETALPMRLSDLPTGYIQALKNTAASRTVRLSPVCFWKMMKQATKALTMACKRYTTA